MNNRANQVTVVKEGQGEAHKACVWMPTAC